MDYLAYQPQSGYSTLVLSNIGMFLFAMLYPASQSGFDAEKHVGYGPPSTRHNCRSRRVLLRGMQLPYLFVAVSLDGRVMGVRFTEADDGEGLDAQPIAGNLNALATMPINVMIVDATGQATCALISGPGQVTFRYS